jgi:cellulose synthase/poly-beta-1,6-N-acetylglucosamine synthase-like glycosyltransferase
MGWIYIATASVAFLYFIIIMIFIIGWNKINPFVPKGNEKIETLISVVVACKNEEKHIRQLISCMAQQSNQNFEFILVNDHSTDATRNYIKAAQASFPKIVLIDSVGHGKKKAQREGILKAQGEIIVVTDADCLPSYHWLESIYCFQKKNSCDLIISPVKLSGKESIFSYLQVLEFTSLVGAAAGSTGAGMPILCNGANLAFTKKMWEKCQNDLHEEQQSGDDMFLLESVKKRGGTIRFLKSESAFVTTKQAESLKEFIVQRRRWTSKSSSYKDWQIILTALAVLGICILMLGLFTLSFYHTNYLMLFLMLFIFKYIVDSLFLVNLGKFFQLNHIWIFDILLSILYPFYVVLIAISSFLIIPKKWK